MNNPDVIKSPTTPAVSTPSSGSVLKEIQLADTLCEKVGQFLFFYTEGTAKEMAAAAKAYDEARKALNAEVRDPAHKTP